MKSTPLTLGRSFGLTFDHGEDFFDALTAFCTENRVSQGYIPCFIASFFEVELVGTSDKLEDPKAPVWSKVHLENVEVLGCGTLAFNPGRKAVQPHIHVSVGLKGQGAGGFTSHLLKARVQFLAELFIVEVEHPNMQRIVNPQLYQIPLLTFGTPSEHEKPM